MIISCWRNHSFGNVANFCLIVWITYELRIKCNKRVYGKYADRWNEPRDFNPISCINWPRKIEMIKMIAYVAHGVTAVQDLYSKCMHNVRRTFLWTWKTDSFTCINQNEVHLVRISINWFYCANYSYRISCNNSARSPPTCNNAKHHIIPLLIILMHKYLLHSH